jgi:FkbM family methyltransferase
MPKVRKWLKKRHYQPSFAIKSLVTQQPAAATIQFDDVSEQHLVPYDENLLERSRTQWQFGDWASLAAIPRDTLQHHPDRAKLALLCAAGHQALGNASAARQHTRLALEWGCGKKLVSQILISGVYHTLGRAAAVSGQDYRSLQQFEKAVATVMPNSDVHLLGHARSVRELVQLGMLPQAIGYVSSARNDLSNPRAKLHRDAAHMKVVDLEIDWLRDRVVHHQKEQFLKSKKITSGPTTPPQQNNTAPKPAPTAPGDAKKYYGLHGLDRKLEAYVDYDDGYFVELGANDGIAQSNTLHFEKERNWQGILIEPILHNFLKCRQNRSPRNRFFCNACVSFDYGKPHVEMTYSNLMTTPSGLESDIADPVGHAKSGTVYMAGEETVPVLAPAKTLTQVLDEAGAPRVLDLLSLDVEGAEIEVLKGIDHARYQFKYMLIECRDAPKLAAHLKDAGYYLIDKLSQHDFLFASEPHPL